MGEFKPTESQQNAIEARGANLLVSAAAGSGKTRVLTERLMSYLDDARNPVDISRFLVITYTNAAAAELRGRIIDSIGQRLAENPNSRSLRRQAALCRTAQIGTIHSYCQSLLRENSQAAGLPPTFHVADNNRARALREAAADKVVEAYYEKAGEPGFQELIDTVGGGRSDKELVKLVLNLYEKIQGHVWPERWAEEQLEAFEAKGLTGAEETLWGRELINRAQEQAEYCLRDQNLAQRILQEGGASMQKSYGGALEQTEELFEHLRRATDENWDAIVEAAQQPFPKLKPFRPSKEEGEEAKTRFTRQWNSWKKIWTEIGDTFSSPSDIVLKDLRQAAPVMRSLVHLVNDFGEEYKKEKKNAELLDFSDLEHETAALLIRPDGTPTELAGEIGDRWTEIMVDEYQDVSPIQEQILQAISANRHNLFMVGDVKQSIYRFRLADPRIFTKKYKSYGDYSSGSSSDARILLRENFRSREEVLNAVNQMFYVCMSERLGELTYDENAALRQGAEFEGTVPKPEIFVLDRSKEAETQEENEGTELEERPDDISREAAFVAQKIRQLVEEKVQVQDGKKMRNVRYEDIAILLRTANRTGPTYSKTLQKLGIPVHTELGAEFFATPEISCVISLLMLLDNPHQDVPLVDVLRSPLVGLSPDELAAIRAADRDHDLYTALLKTEEKIPSGWNFVMQLRALREIVPDLPVSELVWKILDEFSFRTVFSAMPDGEQRLRNLALIPEYAEDFERAGARGLRRFLLWLQRAAENGGDRKSVSAENSVQILSIHKAKGLEFPIVFYCDTAHSFSREDTKAAVTVHPELGFGPRVLYRDQKIRYPTVARQAIEKRTLRENLSEELRLVYVAMTRAKERLIITASLKKRDQKLKNLRQDAEWPMPPELLERQNSAAEWLLYAAFAGKAITVTPADPVKEETKPEREKEAAGETEQSARQTLRKRINYHYPYAEAVQIPSKVTATELKRRMDMQDPEAERLITDFGEKSQVFRELPYLQRTAPLSAAETGVATHTVLQHLDFQKTKGRAELDNEIQDFCSRGLLRPEEAAAVDRATLLQMLASGTGEELRKASPLNRETRFSVLLPSEQLGFAAGEQILVQGTIDAWYEENGQIVLLDYKTDHIREEEAETRAEKYRPQMEAYRLALEAVTGKTVKKTILYFLRCGKAVQM
jgi:ATP-dependent helicase/nuclease subunit A